MRHINRLRAHHEKSVRILDMIEILESRIKSDVETYEYMNRVFRSWTDKQDQVDRIKFQKKVRDRLVNYYCKHQSKLSSILQLGQILNGKEVHV